MILREHIDSGGSQRGMTISTPNGSLRGAVEGDHLAFLGIPYALPPVGERRFRPAVAAPPWEGIRVATATGPICPQHYDAMDALLGAGVKKQSEADCLNLNVWVPRSGRKRADTDPVAHQTAAALPVMVWIHGGALVGGSASWEQYDGSAFARDGVLLVGINYRLHSLGFLNLAAHFPQLPAAVNLGLQDAVTALRWVRDNIASFGGDPGNVTIFGESAGGALVDALRMLPAAAGLFRRAILQSGTARQLLSDDDSSLIAANALALLNVTPGDIEALESVPVEDLVALAQAPGLLAGVSTAASIPWLLSSDPRALSAEVVEAEEDRDPRIDLLLGWTTDEYRLRWLTEEPPEETEGLFRLPESTEASMRSLYRSRFPGMTSAELDERITNDQHFFAPVARIAEAHLVAGGNVHLYEFMWRTPVQNGRLGSCHALELPFVFDREIAPGFHGTAPLPRGLIEAMHSSWIAFARTGDPSTPTVQWPSHSRSARWVMSFDEHWRAELSRDEWRRTAWARVAASGIGIA